MICRFAKSVAVSPGSLGLGEFGLIRLASTGFGSPRLAYEYTKMRASPFHPTVRGLAWLASWAGFAHVFLWLAWLRYLS